MTFDTLIRHARVVTPSGVVDASVGIAEGRIIEIGSIDSSAHEEIDARGLHLFPGVIDPHVHFNEPGRAEWEGIATGSAALAAGGGSCFLDMPLNSSPPTLDGPSFDLKRQAAEASSHTDFALWGGLTPNSLAHMEELADRGVIGFKAFMCDSGIDDFQRADDWTLERGMQKAAALGLPVAVHAENQELVAGKTRSMRATSTGLTVLDWVETREAVAEAEAISRAILLARATGCKLHIVHVSSRLGVETAVRSMAGTDVTVETCPHYFMLTHEDVVRIGPAAKCAPPIREKQHGDALWEKVLDASINFIGSDHSPSPPSMKTGDFFSAWGGVSGVQSTLSAMLTRRPPLPPERVASLTAGAVARRFSLPGKGRIAPGFDADLALVDLDDQYTLSREMLLDRHRLSPYAGMVFNGRVVRTLVRGHTVFSGRKLVGDFRGRLVTPAGEVSRD